MPSPLPLSSRDLHETNLRLTSCLDLVVTGQNQRRVITQEEISSLLSELMRAGAELHSRPIPAAGDDAGFDSELRQYCLQVERLRDLLPAIHAGLLVERARIEAQQSRMLSAAEWARASQQTL